ncbi:hypothetical protein Bbelb_277480, partial [Branchiostoma belcheri]
NPQPQNLTCSSKRSDAISLHWTYPSAHLSGCHIWYQDVLDDDAEPTELMTSLPSGNRSVDVIIDGLKSGTVYNVTVRAVVGTTESLDVTVQCMTEMDTPQFLFCSAATTYTSLAVTWTRPNGPLQGYIANLTLAGDRSNHNLTVVTTNVGPQNETFVFYNVVADQEYRVALVATGLYTDSWPVEVICATLTPPPEEFHVTDITETTVRVSWKKKATSIAIGQRIWIRRSDTAEVLVTRLVPTSPTDVSFDDLVPAMEYIISATSINRYNEGLEVTVTAATGTDPPKGISVDDWTTDTISISWQPPKAALTGYNITYTGNGRRVSVVQTGDRDSCELTGLVPATRYDVSVVAVSRLGRSISVRTSAVTDTDPPSSLTVSVSSATWMFLEWKPALAKVVFYEIDISDGYGSAITVLRIEGNKKSYNVTNVLPETAYVIKMAAFSEYGRSVDVSYSHRTGSISSMEVNTVGSTYTTTASTTDEEPTDATTPTSTPTWPSTSAAARNAQASTRRKGKGPVPFDQSLQTTASTSTSPGRSTEASPDSTTSTSGWSTHITSLERTRESPGQKKSTADLVSDLADAMKGSQGASVQNMGTIANALVQTASAVVDMLPEPETPIGSTADNLFGSYIDINNADLSPKQQLKILKDKQKEKENAQQETAQSIVASLDKVADTLLALQPVNVEYQTSFRTKDVAVSVVRSSSKKDIQLDSDHIVVDIPGRETQSNDMLDVKVRLN